MRLDKAHEIANDLIDWLEGSCDRIEIAGSVRRRKQEVKDIEIVAIPKYVKSPQAHMFGPKEEAGIGGMTTRQSVVSRLEVAIGTMTQMPNPWRFDDKLKRNGPRYKRLKHVDSGMVCDLFITTPEQWGLIFTIRTGPTDFSKAIVTEFHKHGWHQHLGQLHDHPKIHNGYRSDPCEKGAKCPLIIPTPEEADVFSLLSWPYLEPRARNDSDRLVRAAAKARR